MSYVSESILGDKAKVKHVREVIKLLGYERFQDDLKTPNQTDAFFWSEQNEYKSYVGIELYISKENDLITVTTRTRAGRSYWDLVQQNTTIKYLRDLFGGYFTTDAGRNRYWHPESKPPTKRESGLFLARWIYNNALIKPKVYLDSRNLDGKISREEPTGLAYMDEMNPRFFSNTLLIPYLVGIWEHYLKSSFIILLKCCENKKRIFKSVKITPLQLENISDEDLTIEEAIGDNLSFQRPKVVAENFKLIDENIDIAGILRKPYRKRKRSLYDSIDSIIDLRNHMVHSGLTDGSLTDARLKVIINDFEVAVDRIYDRFGNCYSFTPNRHF
ncbi:HEPN domain-containing protein [Herbivorax sp. ANBcel31]|uniref:HEPN domain-containing protein n=1 Tax=Herbivorax sp. ANBcel31 TaxID=3069754 RepID=UPI0027B67FF1|nr:HEPN domain-containing protein [Herbivorax sp. ANBcel31]MDQ2086873.1 HEPN domain-containing protein [Herbivorax sp. ANBcel31]